MHVPSAQGGQKKASDPLKLELQTIVRHHMVSGNQTLIFWKRVSALNC